MKVLAIALALLTALVAITPANAQSQPGTIFGFVFEDRNNDGVFQSDPDIGLFNRTVTVSLAGGGELTATSESNGAFTITGVPEGTHEITTELDSEGLTLCADSFGGFDPFRVDDCFPTGRVYYDPTTLETQTVTVSSGQSTEVSFGGQLRDIANSSGIALLNGDYAPVGTTVQARRGGVDCGSTQVTEAGGNGNMTYLLEILGSGERAGCPGSGESFELLVDGILTQSQPVWHSPSIVSGAGELVAMPNHAWYWAEMPLESSPVEGAVLSAKVGNVTCGQATITQTFHVGARVFGFQRLVVPSESIVPGCGRPGATVTFWLGAQALTTTDWRPSEVLQVPLPLDKPVTVPPAEFPKTGGAPSPSDAPDYAWYLAGTATLVLLAAAFIFLRGTTHRRHNQV